MEVFYFGLHVFYNGTMKCIQGLFPNLLATYLYSLMEIRWGDAEKMELLSELASSSILLCEISQQVGWGEGSVGGKCEFRDVHGGLDHDLAV